MKHALAFLAAFALGFLVVQFTPTEAAPAPDPTQVNPDIFDCCGLPSVFAGWTPGDLSTLNPLTVKLRSGVRTITYSYIVVPGCSDGNMYDNLQVVLAKTSEVTGRVPGGRLDFVKVATGADVSIRATCGTDAANVGVTGGVIGDLYPGWPYQSVVNINTIMATYPNLTQQSIWCHEFCGHALGTWNEGYYKNGTFGSVPGFVDFMNTGPDSRYLWPQNDIDRWSRTVFDLTPVAVECQPWLGFDPCTNTFIREDGWRQHLDDGSWYDWLGRRQYDGCNGDGYRWSPTQGRWKVPGDRDGFDADLSQWITVPAC